MWGNRIEPAPLIEGSPIFRLIEKWFLLEKLGEIAKAIQLEKNYWQKLNEYYNNIKKPGLEYEELDHKKSLDFLLMTVQSL